MGVSLFGLIFFLVSVGVRIAMLNLYLWVLRWGHRRWRVLIYGAGTTGIQLAAALKSHDSVMVVAFLDDNTGLQSMTVAGLRVLSPDRIEHIVKERVCGSGMRWKRKALQAVLSLRALTESSDRWEQFWSRIERFGY